MGIPSQRGKEDAMERISVQSFHMRTGIGWFHPEIRYVISLRDMDPNSISGVRVMKLETLSRLLEGVVLERNVQVRPYAKCPFRILQLDPEDLLVGQTFVQRKKYQFLLEKFSGLFGTDFCTDKTLSQCGPLIVFGPDAQGTPCVAFYLPPIVEETDGKRFLIDGVHRNFIVRAVGGSIKAIVIRDVATPLPCDPIPWGRIKIVREKPVRHERFRNLRSEFFRNTKFAGIDG